MPQAAFGRDLPDRLAYPFGRNRLVILSLTLAALLLGAAYCWFRGVGPRPVDRYPEFRLRAILGLGRNETVIADADRVLARHPEFHDVRLTRYRALLRHGDPRWKDEFEELTPDDPVANWEFALETARALLSPAREVPVDGAAALGVVRGLSELEQLVRVDASGTSRRVEGADGQVTFVNVETIEHTWAAVRRLEADALDALGRTAEAEDIRRKLPD